MTVDYKFKKGIDIPAWQYMNFWPGVAGFSQPGCGSAFDGSRYIYYAIQFGSSTAASTAQLWRFDTFTNGWQYLAALTNTFAGVDVEWDDERQVLWICEGNTTTAWRYFNPNKASVTVGGVATAAMALSAAMTVVLPATAGAGANFISPAMIDVPATLRNGTTDTGSTTTTIVDIDDVDFHGGYIGCNLRITSGTLSGASSVITAVADVNTLTVGQAFASAVGAGATYVIEAPGNGTVQQAATGGSTTTLVDTGSGWPVNIYRDADVEILSGPGAGQRRRIASNTSDTLTLAAATVGNVRTGPFTTAPTSASTFRIVPSTDFLYYNNGNTTTGWYRTDLVATTRVWTVLTALPVAPAGGGYACFAPRLGPFSIFLFRGANSSGVFRYDTGLATWATCPAVWGAEVMAPGATATRAPGGIGFFIHIAGTTRILFYNIATGMVTPITNLPYAPPGVQDGKRLRYVRSPDGANFLYMLRGSGQEFFRIPLEFMDA